MNICICACRYIYIYTHTHAHTHTHLRTFLYILSLCSFSLSIYIGYICVFKTLAALSRRLLLEHDPITFPIRTVLIARSTPLAFALWRYMLHGSYIVLPSPHSHKFNSIRWGTCLTLAVRFFTLSLSPSLSLSFPLFPSLSLSLSLPLSFSLCLSC